MGRRIGWSLSLVCLIVVTGACGPPAATPEATSEPGEIPGATPTDGPTTESGGSPTATPVTGEPAATHTPTASGPSPTPSPTAAPTVQPTARPFEPVVGLELVAEGLTAPVGLRPAGDGSGRLFIVDQVGQIRVIGPEGELLGTPFLDLRDRMVALNPGYDERGLLGLAIPPNFGEAGRFAVYYSAPLAADAPEGWNHTSQLSWFTASAENENVGDPASEQTILQVHQPQGNHNGGEIAFGPDGHLYVALGDGGGANDVGMGHVEDWYEANRGGNGQDVSENWLGSILRIDPGAPGMYEVPETNPLVDDADGGLPEIWAYGFRNPYRFSFDAGGEHELFVADVGQNLWEEVNIVNAGGNYGWNVKEGAHCFSASAPNQPPEDCPSADPDGRPLIHPVFEYQNANAPGGLGLAVVGGYVYRGEALPSFVGRYVFGDWSTSFGAPGGKLFAAARPDAEGEMWSFQELEIADREGGRLGLFVLGFGQDADGELYVLTSENAGPRGNTGKVWRIVPAG